MQIPDDALNEFIAIYRAEFDEEISRKDAGDMASRLLRLYELLTRKLPKGRMTTGSATPPMDDHQPIGFRT